MDNLIFKGKMKEELHQNTLEGLKILEKHDLYIKESKCYWEVEEVPVLGHIVGKGCLQMEATKVKTILEWEMLKGHPKVQWVLQLLPSICARILKGSPTYYMPDG